MIRGLHLSYEESLRDLGLFSLEDLINPYKYLKGLSQTDGASITVHTNITRINRNKL